MSSYRTSVQEPDEPSSRVPLWQRWREDELAALAVGALALAVLAGIVR